jgi:hypothetical protein
MKRILLLISILMVSIQCYGYRPDEISKALQDKYPGALYTLYGTSYEGLVWHDKTYKKPTEAEFNAALDVIPSILAIEAEVKKIEAEEQEKLRVERINNAKIRLEKIRLGVK